MAWEAERRRATGGCYPELSESCAKDWQVKARLRGSAACPLDAQRGGKREWHAQSQTAALYVEQRGAQRLERRVPTVSPGSRR